MSTVSGPDASENERKGQKRKHSETLSHTAESTAESTNAECVLREIQMHIGVLRSTFSHLAKDRDAARQAAHALADYAKKGGNIDVIVQNGAVDALVPHLAAPPLMHPDDSIAYEHEVEKDAAFALGLLAIKPEHQRLIADAGALPALITLLQRPLTYDDSRVVYGAIRRAADAITNMAHENANIKSRVRTEGAIPPLVSLLECPDIKVQRAAAGSLRTLAFKNEQNKVQIVECQALPTLVFMLRSEDVGIHYEAVGVLGNLVHSSPTIKKRVLEEGALQPVISLLSSRCPESQREAALLLGQFSTAEPDCKVRIVQRGAVRPLIKMLEAPDLQLKEMAAFALGRLAQNKDNEAGIVHDGGLRPLLELLDSKSGAVQHNAAFALYGLADNEDNLAEIVREGGVERLREAELILQASKDCVQKTLKRLEEKISGRVLRHLLYLLRSVDKETQRRVAIALAHLSGEEDQRLIFVEGGGLEVLLDMMGSTMTPKLQKEGALAVYTLAKKAAALSPVENAPPPPTPQVYLGEQYVNCRTLSDVSFVVEGNRFYAHRIALLASSDAFRAMFDGGYREKQAEDIEIPNISWKVFEAMMRHVYTGAVDVTPDIAQDLLRAADQYLLEGLKRQCEYAIAKDLSVECVSDVYELAEAYHASTLRHQCVIFTLEHHEQTSALATYTTMIQRMVPEIREYIHRVLRPKQVTPPVG